MSQPFRTKNQSFFSRRRFLHVAGSGTLAALLAGCGLGRDEPTPTPTRTPRPTPTVTPTATPSPDASPLVSPLAVPTPSPLPDTPVAQATATASVTPEPTDTPPPSATPTPTATPFPPGPPTKLGLFISRNEPKIRDLLSTGNVPLIKTLEYDPNFAVELKQRAPAALLIGRMDLPQLDLSKMTDPAAEARAFVDRLLPIATESRRMQSFDGWESYNEPVVSDADQMTRLAQFEAERTRLLADAGIHSVVGNFASGTPPLELWPQFRPAIDAAIQYKGYLGLHEYAAPTMQFGTPQDPLGWGVNAEQEGWLTLRYRKVYRQFLQPNGLNVPILLTEVGIDGQVANRPGPAGKGWQDFAAYWDQIGMGKDAPGNYVEQLAWYDANLQLDPYILGAAIFAAGASPGWGSFEILDQVEPFLQQYLSVHPVH